MSPRHTLSWEEGGLAGLKCDGGDGGTLDAGREGWTECEVCGCPVRLIWIVYVKEASAP